MKRLRKKMKREGRRWKEKVEDEWEKGKKFKKKKEDIKRR